MKNLKIVFLLLLVLSCSQNDNFSKESENSVKLEILEFASLEDMNIKIDEINVLKDKKETEIIDKILLKNKIEKPISNINSKNSNNLKDLTYADIEDDVEFYHKEKLNSIYKLREELGFVSLQSVVEEINSLKLFDLEKAEKLYTQYGQYLGKSKFGTYSIFGDDISIILNSEGKVMVGNELIDISSISNKLNENEKVNGNYTYDDGDLVVEIGGPFIVSWEAGKLRDRKNLFWRYAYYTRILGFAKTQSSHNQYVSYPVTIVNNALPGYCQFKSAIGNITVNFGGYGGTSSSFFNYYSSSRSFYLDKVLIHPTAFSVVVNNQIYSATSQSVNRDYDIYNPNDPIYD